MTIKDSFVKECPYREVPGVELCIATWQKKKKKQYHRPHPKTNSPVKNNMFSYCSLKSSFLKFGLILALRLFNVEEKIFTYSLEATTSKSF